MIEAVGYGNPGSNITFGGSTDFNAGSGSDYYFFTLYNNGLGNYFTSNWQGGGTLSTGTMTLSPNFKGSSLTITLDFGTLYGTTFGGGAFSPGYERFSFQAGPTQLSIAPSDKTETAPVPLAWKSAPSGLALQDVEITQPATGVIHFTDSNPTALPSATIVGAPVITATDLKGQSVTLSSSQLALLQTAFTITPEAGNTNDGAIDWTFNYQGQVGDLDFLSGRSVTVTNTVQVADQSGNTDTATVANTLTLAPTGIDYRYNSADDPLARIIHDSTSF
jgi:hypothetical protein